MLHKADFSFWDLLMNELMDGWILTPRLSLCWGCCWWLSVVRLFILPFFLSALSSGLIVLPLSFLCSLSLSLVSRFLQEL